MAKAWAAVQIMHRETVRDVADLTGAAITTRGVYVPPGHRLPEGERKLYLLIQVRHAGTSCVRALCRPEPLERFDSNAGSRGHAGCQPCIAARPVTSVPG